MVFLRSESCDFFPPLSCEYDEIKNADDIRRFECLLVVFHDLCFISIDEMDEASSPTDVSSSLSEFVRRERVFKVKSSYEINVSR